MTFNFIKPIVISATVLLDIKINVINVEFYYPMLLTEAVGGAFFVADNSFKSLVCFF